MYDLTRLNRKAGFPDRAPAAALTPNSLFRKQSAISRFFMMCDNIPMRGRTKRKREQGFLIFNGRES